MQGSRKLARTGRSRRDFAKYLGLAVAGSALSARPVAGASTEENDVAALAKLATQGSPVRLTGEQMAEMKKLFEEGRKGLDKIRAFKLQASVEPAFLFRAQ